jgi:alpha-tubulin suppressor-like RCC1 family protein
LGYVGSSTDTTDIPSSTPIDLGPGRTAVAVSAGSSHTCVILDNGVLKCWGGSYGLTPTTVIGRSTGQAVVAVSTDYTHICAILDNGDLTCWGSDNYGQLGDGGGNTDTSGPSFAVDEGALITAIDLGANRTAVAVSAGYSHTCAILDNGDMKCWGRDNYGQLGDGGSDTNTDAPSSTPIDLGTNRTAVAVSAGGSHTCAILDNGDMKCWGADTKGQLGDGGSDTDQASPVLVNGSNTWNSSTESSRILAAALTVARETLEPTMAAETFGWSGISTAMLLMMVRSDMAQKFMVCW